MPENIKGNGENTAYHYLLLFSLYFYKVSSQEQSKHSSKHIISWKKKKNFQQTILK